MKKKELVNKIYELADLLDRELSGSSFADDIRYIANEVNEFDFRKNK